MTRWPFRCCFGKLFGCAVVWGCIFLSSHSAQASDGAAYLGGYILESQNDCEKLQLIIEQSFLIYPNGQRRELIGHKKVPDGDNAFLELQDTDGTAHIFLLREDKTLELMGQRYGVETYAEAPRGFRYKRCDVESPVHWQSEEEELEPSPSLLNIRMLNEALSASKADEEVILHAIERVISFEKLESDTSGTVTNLGQPVQHPLITAILKKHDHSIVTQLLEKGSDPNLVYKKIPIAVYTYCSQRELFEDFVARGLNMNQLLSSGVTLKEKLKNTSCP
jgi:hypothetical protein